MKLALTAELPIGHATETGDLDALADAGGQTGGTQALTGVDHTGRRQRHEADGRARWSCLRRGAVGPSAAAGSTVKLQVTVRAWVVTVTV